MGDEYNSLIIKIWKIKIILMIFSFSYYEETKIKTSLNLNTT